MRYLGVVLCALSACGRLGFDDTKALATISSHGDHACGLTETGVVACWGTGEDGQLGRGDQPPAAVARPVPLGYAAELVGAGEGTTCTAAGDIVDCFGDNQRGEVGPGLPRAVTTPQRVPVGAPVVDLELGQHGALALTADGRVRYWGGNACGQAGTGAAGPAAVPTPVPGISGATMIGISDVISCAVDGAGAITCWGAFEAVSPELDACTTETLSPPTVRLQPGAPVVDLDGGCHDHVCAALADGSVWCVGTNSDGQLGTGDKVRHTEFVQVVGIDDAIDVAVGAFHTCALRRSGAVVCWGRGDVGQLGDGVIRGNELRPVATLPLPEPIEQLEAGCAQTCARAGHRLWCWGGGTELQLGNGVIADSPVPVEAWFGPDPLGR